MRPEIDMQPRMVLPLLLILTGLSFAQDTNFSTGPQYLITTSSPRFLRPISTPSLSLSEAQPATATLAQTETALAQEMPVPSTITNQTFLSDVYWGDHSAREVDARRLVTPSLSPSQMEINTVATATEVETPATPEVLPGISPLASEGSNVIEISSGTLPSNLPASIFDPGVTGAVTEQSLRDRGYGMPLGDVAAYWKAHKGSAVRVFTNHDIEGLHGG
jgi:hypothetical protein